MKSWQASLAETIRELRQGNREGNGASHIAIVGIGHELCGDDAAGTAVAQALAEWVKPVAQAGIRLSVLEGGHAPENCSPTLRRLAPDLILLIDTAYMKEPPGTIRWLDWRKTAGLTAATHRMPLHLLARYLVMELHCDVALIGIEPAEVNWDTPLSSAGERAMAEVRDGILSTLMDITGKQEDTMERDFLAERRKALEETFFAEYNEKLLQQLRARRVQMEQRDAMAAACGVCDEEVLDELMALHMTTESVAALALVPLVIVAWADGVVADEERDAILHAAEQKWLARESEGYQLLETWLHHEPPRKLLIAWQDYVSALAAVMGDKARQQLRDDILGNARAVAEAAGGLFGFYRISVAEQAVLAELAEAFAWMEPVIA